MTLDKLIIELQNTRVNLGRGDLDVLNSSDYTIDGVEVEEQTQGQVEFWGAGAVGDKFIRLRSWNDS